MRYPRHFRRARGVVGAAALSLGAVGLQGAPAQPEPVAIVASLSGIARVKPPERPARELALFDRLPAGSKIDVRPESVVVIAFATGHRFQLEGGARVTVTKEDLADARGAVRAIEAVPPFHRIPPVRDVSAARTAALRVRGGGLNRLYPREGATTMSDLTVLSFSAPPEAGDCTAEVLDTTGNSVSKTAAGSSPLALAPGLLAPGQSYEWRVRCLTASGVILHADARFATLPLDMATARQALHAAAAADPALLGLLAEIDQSLGMFRESRDGFRAALAREPGNAALASALDRLDRWMDDSIRER